MISKQKRARESASLKQVLKDLGYTHCLLHMKVITNGIASKLPAQGGFQINNTYTPTTYIVNDDTIVQSQAPYNANAGFIHKQALKDRQDMIALLDSEMTEEEIETVINQVLDSLWKVDETATTNATIDFYVQTLSSITGLTIYERIMNGESIRVKFKNHIETPRKTPFMVYPLYLISPTQYVTKSSAYFKWSSIGGIRIGHNKHVLSIEEMIEWCDSVQEVKI